MVESAQSGLPKGSKSITNSTILRKNREKAKGVEIKWYYCKKCKEKFTSIHMKQHIGNGHFGRDVTELSRDKVPQAR